MRTELFIEPKHLPTIHRPSTQSSSLSDIGETVSKSPTMCQVTGFRSRSCGHRWLTVTKSCGPGVGFTTHPRHEFKGRTALFGGPKYYDASADTCPICDLKGQYNGNTTRMVLTSGERVFDQRAKRYGRFPTYPVTPLTNAFGAPLLHNGYGYFPAYAWGLSQPARSAQYGWLPGGACGITPPCSHRPVPGIGQAHTAAGYLMQ